MGHFWRFLKRTDAGLLIAAALAMFAIQPLLQPGLPTSADLIIHLYRTLEFERAWAPGVIVPRWAPNLAYGYGYPLFIFAPPLPYFLAMLFHATGLTLESAFKLLIILTILLYAIGMYLFIRDLLGSVAATLVAAVAYTFAPFALREALLEGGNIPQLLAIGLFPWPLWAITRAVRQDSWGWTVLAGIFYAAIMLSHLFQAFVFTPVFTLYTLLLILQQLKIKNENLDTSSTPHLRPYTSHIPSATIKTSTHHSSLITHHLSLLIPLLALPIGLLLSVFFWLPAFIERNLTRAQADIYLEKSPFFVRYPHWSELLAWIQPFDTRAANPYTPLTLGVVTIILAGLGLLASVISSQKSVVSSQQNNDYVSLLTLHFSPLRVTPHSSLLITLFFSALALGAAFMSIAASRRVWEIVSILQVAEFPWRMLGLANLGLAVLAGQAVLLAPSKWRQLAAGICIAALLLAVAPYLYPVVPFSRFGTPTIAHQINYERSSQSIGTTTLGEYLPQTVSVPPATSPLVESYQSGHIPDRLDRASLPTGGQATLLEQTAVTHRYQLNSPADFTLRLFHFNFPGWQANLDDNPLNITTEAETGLMLLDIPAGQHTLTIHFGETSIRALANGLTAVTILALLTISIVLKLQQKKTRSEKVHFFTPKLNLTTVLLLCSFIISAALWLKPLLRPVFTITSPREQVLAAQHPTGIRFANGIQLVGYDVSRRVVQPGDYLQVTLYWQTDSAPHRVNLQPFVHLDRLDSFTTAAGGTNYTPGNVTTETNLPTFHWDNFRYARDEHDLTIPPDTPPLAYALRAGLIDPDRGGQLVPLADGSGDTAWLDVINVSPLVEQKLAQSLDVAFSSTADTIHLAGYEITALTPERLEFTLAWQSDRVPGHNYTVFTQLLDANQNLAASFDRPPLDGAYPTSTWLPNQLIIDPRILPLEGVPPGNYTLITGLYDPANGKRMITNNDADFVELSTITIPNNEPSN